MLRRQMGEIAAIQLGFPKDSESAVLADRLATGLLFVTQIKASQVAHPSPSLSLTLHHQCRWMEVVRQEERRP